MPNDVKLRAALGVVRQLEAEPRMKQLLQQAREVLIVPWYGRAALGVGAHGGAIAMVLNNVKAVDEFMKKNNFSLSAEAGLTVVNWSRLAQGSAGTGDVVAWSGTKGLFGDAVAVGVNDIRFNQALTNAYYGRTLSPRDIADGSVSNPQAQPLQQALGQASTVTR